MPARLRTLLALSAVSAGLLAMAAPSYAVTPTPACGGTAVAVTDANNDQYILTPATGLVARPGAHLDIERVFTLDGTTNTVNIQVANLPAAPLNTDYTFRWDDSIFTPGYWDVQAIFRPSGATYVYTHYLSDSGAPFVLRGTTGTVHAGTSGVIAIDLPAGETFPASMQDLQVRAEQYESNATTAVALRVDTATAASYTKPC